VSLIERPHEKLPFWSTVGRSYAVWTKNLRELARMSWLWLVVTSPFLALYGWWYLPTVFVSPSPVPGGHPEPETALSIAWDVLDKLITLPMMTSIAVAWHRLLLRGERGATATYLRFDRIVISYGILAFVLYLITVAADVLRRMMGPYEPASIEGNVLNIGTAIVLFAAHYVSIRISVCLPATALGRQDVTPEAAWMATEGNGLRLMAGDLLTGLPAGLGAMIVFFVTSPGNVGVWVCLSVLFVFAGMIQVGFLSIAYKYFFEQDTTIR
jgi:hypothetical protein